MNENKIDIRANLSLDEKTVTVRLGSKVPVVAGCLGVDRTPQGDIQRIYLDRLIHDSVKNRQFATWAPSGAITTILHRL